MPDVKTTVTQPFILTKRFVALMACLTGLTAMGIDLVLPIFPEMIDYFALPSNEHNRIQQVVFVYMLGFSIFQLFFGILADVAGRKLLLLIGISVYTLATASVIFMQSFESVLWARFIQGAGLAAPRVLSMTIIRDVSSGREMSRVMSFVTMVFLAIPALAPIVGQLLVLVAPWQSLFALLTALGIGLIVWVCYGLQETLPAKKRAPLSVGRIKMTMQTFLTNRETLLYLVMIGLLFGGLMTYIGQAEQILQKDVYQLGKYFPLAFAIVILGMVGASVTNARLVMRLGMEKMVFAALGIIALADIILLISTLAGGGITALWWFIVLLVVHFFGFSLAMPNLNTLALAPYRHIAGMASALIGTLISIIGVMLAQFISSFFNGTLYAIVWGFAACTTVLWLAYWRLNK